MSCSAMSLPRSIPCSSPDDRSMSLRSHAKNTLTTAMIQRVIPVIYTSIAMNAMIRLVAIQGSVPTRLKTLSEYLMGVHRNHAITSRLCDQVRRTSG